MTAPFHDAMPVGDARALLRDLAKGDGAHCPVCRRLTKVRRRNMTSVAARAVASLYRRHGRCVGHLPTVVNRDLADIANQGGYVSLGQHWGLIEEEKIRRPDGGRAGYWSVTALGESWLRGETRIPKYVDLYDSRRLGEPYGELITARQVLDTHFDLIPLRAAAADHGPDEPFAAAA